MFSAIFGAIAALITWFAKSKIKKLSDEKAEYRDALCEIDLALSIGDEDRVNHKLDDVLRRLPSAKGGSDSGG
jgi:hypothetical protein